MKLYFMKKRALDNLKGTLPDIYTKYSTEKFNGWLKNIVGEEPFIEFREVPDFTLHIERDSKGKVLRGKMDFENCKIIYRNLIFLSESQASDERLWAGLCHSIFYDYMRQRWQYDKMLPKSAEQIKLRYFFENRAGIFSNALARCWWTGHLLYDATRLNPFEKLDIIGASDIRSKMMLIFNNSFSRNQNIVNGIVKCFRHFNEQGIKLNDIRHQVSPAMQQLNAIGGTIVLDCLSEDEIADILIKAIEDTLNGKKSSIVYESPQDVDADYEPNEDANNLNMLLGMMAKNKR